MEPRLKPNKNSRNLHVNVSIFRSIIGGLRYLVYTRPDIAFAIGYLSRFMEEPTIEYLNTVKHLFRYIAGTRNYGCCYLKCDREVRLIGYNNSDMAGDVDDRKSTTGTLFLLGDSPILWQSQKQRIVALSSCEAKYVAAATIACQGVWLGHLIGDLLDMKPVITIIHVDNKSAIQMCKNLVFHNRSKEIETRYHFIWEFVEEGKVLVESIGTNNQLADILTKSPGRVRFQELRGRIRIVDTSSR
ncbi:secreted RxLR effector protein 161-like [Phragmites australis]|uniref:secreted RxLR effector protein 161-like n=1 Tax=Phragmites australis TaxID=29695 RepID=UPI002D769F72|nr:secreted RxLR effector protein 161-like [Phragmites australis]